jgi:hypothetical protein
VRQLGIPGQPSVEIYPVHRVFSPGYRPTRDFAGKASGKS